MDIPREAKRFIAMHHLGAPKKVYKPNTVGSIIGGLVVTVFAVLWINFALILTGSSLLPKDQTSTQLPLLPASTASSFTTTMTILGVVLPLVGLILVGVGLRVIISALRNRHIRVIVCDHGVAHIARDSADAFRWEQVATVLDKVDVHTHRTDNEDGSTSTSTTTSHTYTVACKDGRRFIFTNTLRSVEQLGEEIQIAVALAQQSGSHVVLEE